MKFDSIAWKHNNDEEFDFLEGMKICIIFKPYSYCPLQIFIYLFIYLFIYFVYFRVREKGKVIVIKP